MATPLTLLFRRAIPLHLHPHLASIQINGHSFKPSKPSKLVTNSNNSNLNLNLNKKKSTMDNQRRTPTCTLPQLPCSSLSTLNWPSYPPLLMTHNNSTHLRLQPLRNVSMTSINSSKSTIWNTLHLTSPEIMASLRHSRSKTRNGSQLAPWLPTPLVPLTQCFITFSSTRTPTTLTSKWPCNLFTKPDFSYASFATTSQNCARKHFTETKSSSPHPPLKGEPWWSHQYSWRGQGSQTKFDMQPITVMAEDFVDRANRTLIDSTTTSMATPLVTTATSTITPLATIIIRPTSQQPNLLVAATPIFGVPLLTTMQEGGQPNNQPSRRETTTIPSSMEQTLQ